MAILDRPAGVPEETVLTATYEDLYQSVNRLLERLGLTMDELAAQAETGSFESSDAEWAWFNIRQVLG